MSDTNAENLAREIQAMLEQPGQWKDWLRQHAQAASEDDVLPQACALVTEALLGAEPPKTALWEQLLIQLAVHSHEMARQVGLNQCKMVLGKLHEMIAAGRLPRVEVVTLAGALTVALAAQRSIRQQIEEVMTVLCERSGDDLSLVGQHCQDIWRRKGQTSGEQGLFCWDIRNGQWRLTQDFKAYRPE